MTNLPNLSKLKINGTSRGKQTESVTAPPKDQIPLLGIFDIHLNKTSTFDFESDRKYPSMFTDEEMVFSCVNGQIAMDSRDEAKRVLDEFFDPRMKPDWALKEFADDEGSFNYTTINVRDDTNDPPWIKRIYEYVDYLKGNRVESAVIRASKMNEMQYTMRRFDNGDPYLTNTKDRLFQELFLTLYAAKVGVGPDIYACQMKPIAQRVGLQLDMYPRVV